MDRFYTTSARLQAAALVAMAESGDLTDWYNDGAERCLSGLAKDVDFMLWTLGLPGWPAWDGRD